MCTKMNELEKVVANAISISRDRVEQSTFPTIK